MNLRFVLQNYKCLVIVDNLNDNVLQFRDEYNTANKHESRCIVTTLKQQFDTEQTYNLPYMQEDLIGNVIDSFSLDNITNIDRDKLGHLKKRVYSLLQ